MAFAKTEEEAGGQKNQAFSCQERTQTQTFCIVIIVVIPVFVAIIFSIISFVDIGGQEESEEGEEVKMQVLSLQEEQ